MTELIKCIDDLLDDLLFELINKTCSLCGEYLHIDEFVEGENWCISCEDNEPHQSRNPRVKSEAIMKDGK
jgi:hypothetical protein